MMLPGFTAESSLYHATAHYRGQAGEHTGQGGGIVPQVTRKVNEQFVYLRSGNRITAVCYCWEDLDREQSICNCRAV